MVVRFEIVAKVAMLGLFLKILAPGWQNLGSSCFGVTSAGIGPKLASLGAKLVGLTAKLAGLGRLAGLAGLAGWPGWQVGSGRLVFRSSLDMVQTVRRCIHRYTDIFQKVGLVPF